MHQIKEGEGEAPAPPALCRLTRMAAAADTVLMLGVPADDTTTDFNESEDAVLAEVLRRSVNET